MGKHAEKSKPLGIRRQQIWPILLGNLLLMIVLCCVVCLGAVYYAVNLLENKLAQTAEMMTDYTAVVGECLAEGKTRAARYADIVAESCYNGTSSATLSVMLRALGALEPENDIGVVDPYGAVTSTRGIIGDVRNESFFTDTLREEGGVYALSGGGIVFTAPLTTPSGSMGMLYIVDTDGLTISKSARVTLSDAGEFCILNGDNECISFVGSRPQNFDYTKISRDGLLYTPSHKIDLRKLLKDGSLRLEENLSDLPQDETMTGKNLIEALSRTYLSAGVWYENELTINGWKTVAFLRQRFDAFSMRELIALLVLAALIICIPIIVSVSRTVSQIVNNRRIAKALLYDPVTGGNNFAHFKQAAAKLVKRPRYNGKVFALAALDVVKFRVFSDVHGHEEGEALLFSIFHNLQKHLRRDELLARYTVDQFAMMLILDPKEDPVARVEKLTRGLSKLYPGENIRWSTGVYAVSDRRQPIERMYDFATVAKDVAKASASNMPVLFDSAMREELLIEQQVETLMEKALQNREFVVYLQPKYGVQSHRLAGAEALVRWNSPERGFVSPGSFIPLFEKNGFILKLDDYILDEVCRIQRAFMDKGRALVPVSVNISRAHFADPGVAAHIKSIVDQYGIPYEMIELEMTESAFFDDKKVLLSTVKQLRKYGFSVSMDDFGSGYSSLNSLKDLPLDVVKLDKAFFDTASDVDRGATLIRDTIRMAKNLHMQVVAEGIETVEQVEFLAETGCDLIQGFFFAKPMPVEDFEKL